MFLPIKYYDHTQYEPLERENIWKPDLIDTIIIVKRNLKPAKQRVRLSLNRLGYEYVPSAAYLHAVSKLFIKKPKK